MSAPVFISYSSRDGEIAQTICQALESRGCKCWISSRDIEAGDNFQEAIVKALRSARVMLLVFTAHANNSNEIKKEIVLAGRFRVTVIPVRVEDVAPNDAFTYEFATRQWIDLFKDWEKEIDRLTTQINAITATPAETGAAETSARPTPFRAPRKFPARLVASLALVAILLAGGGYFLYQRFAGAGGEQSAWTDATGAGTPEAFGTYLKTWPNGAHAEEAQQRMADLQALPANNANYDGTWQTTISCPAAAGGLGFAYQLTAKIANGEYHGQLGAEGKPGSLALDGKVLTGGVLDLFAKGIVGASSYAAGGAVTGTPYFYHVAGRINGATGTGHRVEGRPCTLTFAKQ